MTEAVSNRDISLFQNLKNHFWPIRRAKQRHGSTCPSPHSIQIRSILPQTSPHFLIIKWHFYSSKKIRENYYKNPQNCAANDWYVLTVMGRSTEEIFALFICIAFTFDALKATRTILMNIFHDVSLLIFNIRSYNYFQLFKFLEQNSINS